MALFEELTWRGLVHGITDPELPALLDKGGLVAYIGFDPTADSLHIGNLLQLCNLRRLQEAGHQVIGLVGGATGMIGDPGGKSQERNLLSSDELARNIAGVRDQVESLLFEGAVVADNAEWTMGLSVLDFLRDVGKHFTVNQMIAKESVKARIERPEQGISYTEFSYMLLQAMDYLHLFDVHGCRLQLGASDQWGNITMGIELVRKVRGEVVYGFTSPLVLKPDGTKFGKSETGTVWLSAERTSPYELYQFFVRTEDSVIGTYLRYFTWLPRERIEELDAATATHPERREAQRALAFEVTSLVHGPEAAAEAKATTEVLFEGRGAADLAAAPVTELPSVPIALVDALVTTGLCTSKSDARRQITGGGVYVENERVTDVDHVIEPTLQVVLRRGKANQHVLRFSLDVPG
jgi:tyrosyl-tRNA synthetase